MNSKWRYTWQVVGIAVISLGGPVLAGEVPFSWHTVDTGFNGSVSVRLADVNRDGRLDLLAASDNATAAADLAWWPNDGTPASGPWSALNLSTTFNNARDLQVADVDRDGFPDVIGVAANTSGSNDIVWWESDGSPDDGGWTAHAVATDVSTGAFVTAVDLDGDGDLDLCGVSTNASDATGDIIWWENDGSPGTGPWTARTVTSSFNGAIRVRPADLDRDGDPDLAAIAANTTASADVAWWENDGSPADGGWTYHAVSNSIASATAIDIADLDQDGDPDLVAASSNTDTGDDIVWWENDGSPADGGWTYHALTNSFIAAAALRVADLDRDGDLDLVGVSGNTDDGVADVAWWESDGSPVDGGWAFHAVLTGTSSANGVRPGDVDGDGDLDLLVSVSNADSGDDIGWLENTTIHRSALLNEETAADVDTALAGAFAVRAADLDRDGDLDLVVATAWNTGLVWRENNGTGAFESWPTHVVNAEHATTGEIQIADLDRDGDPDIVASKNAAPRDIVWFENNGSPADGPWTTHTVAASVADERGGPRVGDLDGDGD